MFDHGETEENPRPVPRVMRINDSAAAVKAPPMTAGHDMPEEWDSFLTSRSGNRGSTGREAVVGGMENHILSFFDFGRARESGKKLTKGMIQV
jgi:hypothetical protein